MNLIVKKGGKPINTVSMGGKVRAAIIDVPSEAVSSFAAEIRASGLSRYVEPNMKCQATLVPNDPNWTIQWGPKRIEADYAWNTTTGSHSVLVAVIDTGIDYDHPDLAANYVPLGYDWVNNDTDPMDDNGHGTHCAGIIAAEIDNGVGIAGLAQVRIMAEKGLNESGYGWEDDLANAIVHAVDQGADILSLSWGDYEEIPLVQDALKYAYNHGVLIFAAAGNNAKSLKSYPAAYDEAIAVTATDSSDHYASFTNFGDWVELAAPGVNIYSTTWDNSYGYMSGTSMACPHAAGVAALIWSHFPNMTRDNVRARLRYTADDLGDMGFDVYYGYGRVNARKAVEKAPPDHDLQILDWNKPALVKPEELVIINITVLNFGASDESNVTVQLLVNGSVVDNTFIDSLISGTSETVQYSWMPTIGWTYNVTAYVVPVSGENLTTNNMVSSYIIVHPSLISPKPGDYAQYRVIVFASATNDTIEQTEMWNLTYIEYVNSYVVNITLDIFTFDAEGKTIENYIYWMTVNTMTRLVEDGNLSWVDSYYLFWVETNIGLGSTINLWYGNGSILGTADLTINGRKFSTWLISMVYEGWSAYGYHDQASGILVGYDEISLLENFHNNITLVQTNVDVTPPTLHITSPEPDDAIARTKITLRWMGVDQETGIDHYSVYLNEAFVTNTTDASCQLSNLREGSNNITVIAYDKAGNIASDKVNVTVDLKAPRVSITSPMDGYATRETNVTVVWTGGDNETGIAYYLVYLDGIQTLNASSTFYTLSGLIEGHHTIIVEAYDLAGNLKSDETTIIVDKTEPTLTIINPENGTNVAGSITIRFLAFDANLLRVIYSINDGISLETVGGTSFMINTTTLTDGSFNLYITAIDRAENSATETLTLIADNAAPTVTITSPKEETELMGTIIIEFNASDINLDKVLLYVDNAEFNVTGTTSYSWDTTALGDGNHKIRLVATDKAGNSAETSVTVNVVNVKHAIGRATLYLAAMASIVAVGIIIAYAIIKKMPPKKWASLISRKRSGHASLCLEFFPAPLSFLRPLRSPHSLQ